MSKPSFEEHHDQHLRSLLESGESLLGVCAASQQRGLFSGGAVALAVTERRLIVQPLDRRGRPEGEAVSIRPEQLSSAKADGAGGGWAELSAVLMDRAAVKLKLRTTDGEKLQLMLMRGEGPLGALGGGEGQRRGVEALAGFFERAGA